MKAFVKASLEGWKDTVANPREAADIVSRHVKGLDPDATFQEVAIVSGLVATPEARAKGLGLIDAKQMAASVDLIAKGTGQQGGLRSDRAAPAADQALNFALKFATVSGATPLAVETAGAFARGSAEPVDVCG